MSPIVLYPETVHIVLALGWMILPPTVGVGLAARASRRTAAAWEAERAARSDRIAAEAVWSHKTVEHAQALAAKEEAVQAAERVSSHAQTEVERLARERDSEAAEAAGWRKFALRHRCDLDDALAALAASYVRVGNRFVRWRADGVYAAPAGQDGASEALTATLTPGFATAGGADGVGRGVQAPSAPETGKTVVAGYYGTLGPYWIGRETAAATAAPGDEVPMQQGEGG